jgi:hypothetical protein
VSCPIYLSPATTRTKPIRLHQVWQPAPVDMDEYDLPDPLKAQTLQPRRHVHLVILGNGSPSRTTIDLCSLAYQRQR